MATQEPSKLNVLSGVRAATAISMIVRYIVFAAGVVAALAQILARRDWNELLAYLQSSDFIAVASVLAIVGPLIWGLIRTGKLDTQAAAFKQVLEMLGLDTQALDPTDKTVPTQPVADKEELVAAVVKANPETIEKMVG
jgi:hypothetical protein